MKKKEIDFTQTLIEITKDVIKDGELRDPLVYCYSEKTLSLVPYSLLGSNYIEILDNLSIQIRTLIRTLKNCTIGVIFEGTVSGCGECSDSMILIIEDGTTSTTISYTLDENRNIIDVMKSNSSVSDCPVRRFQNFYKTDSVFNKFNVNKIISKDIFITDYKTDILNIVKNVTLVTEKDFELSFVLYKKMNSNKLFSSMLDFETSTRDVDVYFDNKKNELVSWIKFYKALDRKTNTKNEMICVYNKSVKTDNILLDVYKIKNDRTLMVIENFNIPLS
jgi:hypothetical protein